MPSEEATIKLKVKGVKIVMNTMLIIRNALLWLRWPFLSSHTKYVYLWQRSYPQKKRKY